MIDAGDTKGQNERRINLSAMRGKQKGSVN